MFAELRLYKLSLLVALVETKPEPLDSCSCKLCQTGRDTGVAVGRHTLIELGRCSRGRTKGHLVVPVSSCLLDAHLKKPKRFEIEDQGDGSDAVGFIFSDSLER